MIRYSLTFIFTFLIFSSCYKDGPNYNSYTITPSTTTEEELEIKANQTVDAIIILKELLSQLLIGCILEPELWNIQSNSVVTRSGCVTSALSEPVGTFPNTLTLTYDSTSACTGSDDNVIQPDVDGVLTAVVNAPILEDVSPSGREFIITLSSPFQIFNHQISIGGDGTIELEYSADGYLVYFPNDVTITDVTGGLTDGYITTYESNGSSSMGKITLSDGTIPDDPDNPVTYIDNLFDININETTVNCQSSINDPATIFCLDVSSTSNLLMFQPFVCGCITDGVIRLRDITSGGNCSTSSGNNNTNSNSTFIFDFGYDTDDPNTSMDLGECDNIVRKEEVGLGTLTFSTMSSCTP
ncbi:MAG: hypothetical protein AAF573_05535 [Bacteroidota bacterium]